MLQSELQRLAEDFGVVFIAERDRSVLEKVVAERKVFLSYKKLTYRAEFRVVEAARALHFTEVLKESGFGLSSGGDDLSPGFGFKKESYKTGLGPREGSIEEQSRLFGKQYSYTFDFGAFRKAVEAAARDAGYAFVWKLFL